MTTFKERRRFPRVARGLSLKLSADTGDLIVETQNISAAGANCIVTDAVPVMTRVAVMILLPSQRAHKPSTRQIRCEGVVVRSEAIRTPHAPGSRYATAIYFSNIKAADQRAIDTYVKQQLAEAQRTLESL